MRSMRSKRCINKITVHFLRESSGRMVIHTTRAILCGHVLCCCVVAVYHPAATVVNGLSG